MKTRSSVRRGRLFAAFVSAVVAASTLTLVAPTPAGAVTLPVSGKAVPSLAKFDTAMRNFMQGHGINAGVLAVERGGKVLLERGYGWRDAAHTTTIEPSALLRIASNSKIVTSRAIDILVDQALLNRTDRVFCTPEEPNDCILTIDPPSGYTRDTRLDDITVQDLVLHQGGWDTAARGSDIAFEVKQAADALGVAAPATKAQLLRWVVGQPLVHDPGTTTVYANIGYVILGSVIEKVTGKPFIDAVRQLVLAPSGTTDMALGHTLSLLRDPREPNYEDPNTGPSLWDPNVTVSLADSYSVEALEGAGGMLSSSRAYVRFLEGWLPGAGWGWTTFGSLPGTLSVAIVTPSGTHLFAALNAREEPDGDDIDQNDLANALIAAEAAITTWPTAEVDTVAPTATAPLATIPDGTLTSNTAVPTRLTWSGSDAQSGVSSYELQRSVDGGAFAAQALPSPTATSTTVSLSYGHTYRFRVRATDRAGRVGALATGQPIVLKAVDDASSTITYSSGWAKPASASSLFSTIHYSSTGAASARLTFSGRGVTLVSTRGPSRGKAQIQIDGVAVATVDLYAAQAKAKVAVFTSGDLALGSHTIKVIVRPTANPASTGKRVDVDAFLLR